MPGDLTYSPNFPTGWEDSPSTATAIMAARLDHVEEDGLVLIAQRAGVSIRFDGPNDITAPEQLQAVENLGLGGAALLEVGNVAGTVAAGDDPRFGGGAGVISVFGRAGAVVAANFDYTADMVGAAEQLDYVADLAGVATVIPTTGSSADIAGGMGISCPPTGVTNRSLILGCGGACQITAAGAGMLGLQIYETTTGTAVLIGVTQLTGTFTTGSGSGFPSFPSVAYDLGPSTTERQFILQCAMIRDSGSGLTANVRSTTTGVVRAWLEGMAK